MKIDIILRTHDGADVVRDWRARYFPGTKQALILGCLRSLVSSIRHVDPTHNVTLTVLDDNSSYDTVEQIKTIITAVPHKFIALQEQGYNNSAFQQWVLCRDSTADLVYSVEDDYLHCTSAIQEMIDTYAICSNNLPGKTVVLYPFDNPEEYHPPKDFSYIIHGSNRHWRSGVYTTNVLMSTPQLFKDNWNLFETLALKFNGDHLKPKVEHYEAANTIWKIWNEYGTAIRFNPIPSIALHMQFSDQVDPFINYQQWWNEYTT